MRIIQKGATLHRTLKLYALLTADVQIRLSVLGCFTTQKTHSQTYFVKRKNERATARERARDSPGLPQVAAGLCWQVTAQCLCLWPSGQKDRPYGATCSGTSCRQCVHSPDWWAGEQFLQTSACRLGTAGTRSIGVLALAWLCVDGASVRKIMHNLTKNKQIYIIWKIPLESNCFLSNSIVL